jgi:hypothetical protein
MLELVYISLFDSLVRQAEAETNATPNDEAVARAMAAADWTASERLDQRR